MKFTAGDYSSFLLLCFMLLIYFYLHCKVIWAKVRRTVDLDVELCTKWALWIHSGTVLQKTSMTVMSLARLRAWPQLHVASSIFLNQLKSDFIFESHLPALLSIYDGFEIFCINGFEYKK